ncbi:DUF535 family protein [Acerihabitans sp. KWT182]|uniref:DUF535 family protein n=1 Tax=Acerihabitans sp. KWT182 TaxID=3157919 RepID=A0AAU7QD52_9GAMM
MSLLISRRGNDRAAVSGWQLALSLFQGKLVPGNAWRRRLYRYTFMLRYLATRAYSGPWLGQLARCPLLPQMLASQPGLPCKPHRSYLAANMGAETRLAALVHHYDYIQSHLPPALLYGHLSGDGFVLATLVAKNNRIFHLRLCSLERLNLEGGSDPAA